MDGYTIQRDEHARMPKNPKLGEVDKLNKNMHDSAHTMHVTNVKAKMQKVSPYKEKKTAMNRPGDYKKGA